MTGVRAVPALERGELDQMISDRLHRRGERYTRGRRVLVDALVAAAAPLSVPELLEAATGVAQSSAYRNLAVLERAGVVHRISTGGDWGRYELDEDLTAHHHHHLICNVCGTVVDFTVSDDLEREVDEALHRAARAHGFLVDHHRLDLVGSCRDCAPTT